MKLNLNAPFTNKTSYGITALNILSELENEGVEVAAFPIGGQADYLPNQNVEPAFRRGIDEFDPGGATIRLYHQFSLVERIGHGWHVGFPVFEGNKFTKQERIHLKSCDDIFVCSEWAKQVISDNGIGNPAFVIPLGVDTSVFKPKENAEQIKKQEQENGTPFRFFYPGKFEYRKGFDIVMQVFEGAFSERDNIEIYFLPFNPFIREQNEEWGKFLLSSKLANKIKILNRLETHEQVAELYQNMDCVVSFSRAEGWNLPLLEGLACGCQIVATNYSGHTEFLTAENAVLIDITDREPMIDGVFFDGKSGSEWLHLNNSLDKLTEGLREGYIKGKINKKGIETAKKFTWKQTVKKILSVLE